MTSSIDSGGTPSGANVVSLARPILHDFTYRICAVCHSPIPPHQLVDDEYRPRHVACDPGRPLAAASVRNAA